MPRAPVYSALGERIDEVELTQAVFGIRPHKAVVHQALVAELAGERARGASTKTRGEVAGSTRKIWRQKGTGRARHGSRKAPIFVGGGIVFGPRPRDHTQRLPKAMRRLAVRSVLSDAVRDGRLIVVEGFGITEGRTRELVDLLDGLEVEGRTALIAASEDRLVRRAARNLPDVTVLSPDDLSLAPLLAAQRVVIDRAALAAMERVLS
ncbi:MAG: 50S ribosomal protein L4 [Armatimonadota bacterium]|nr:50S ribosomal protein L4 [Armatimonadota bacterium]MDR5697125.1 50S ribosomal protein L4 [Armatimonadota bacterium]